MIAAAGLAVALGAAGVPLLDRLVVRVDPDWLGMLTVTQPVSVSEPVADV